MHEVPHGRDRTRADPAEKVNAPEHLGSQKYTSTARAVGELVANGFDAGATVVDITFAQNEFLGVQCA